MLLEDVLIKCIFVVFLIGLENVEDVVLYGVFVIDESEIGFIVESIVSIVDIGIGSSVVIEFDGE